MTKENQKSMMKHVGTVVLIAGAVTLGLFVHSWASNKLASRKAVVLTPSSNGEEA